MTRPHGLTEISLLAGEQVPRAFWLLLEDEPERQRAARVTSMVAAAHAGAIDITALVGAWRDDKLVGAVWGQILPGNTALLWPPRVMVGEPDAVADRLLERADHLLAGSGVCMAQAMLAKENVEDIGLLLRHGYQRAAKLLYLCWHVEDSSAHASTSELCFEPYREDQRDRLTHLIEQTYEGTLDVPALDGVRDMRDILEGYRNTGEYSPERWFIIRVQGRDVGCLLLADHPDAAQWELVYMALIPQARGNAWGRDIVRHAQRLVAQAGRERLVLAVDAHNDPAIATYAKASFVEWFRRVALLKVWR